MTDGNEAKDTGKALPVRKMTVQTRMRFGFSIFLIVLFAYAFWSALGFLRLARYLPLAVTGLALVVMVISFIIDIVAYRKTGIVAGDDVPVTASLAGAELKEIVLEEQKASGEVDLKELGLEDLEDERMGEIEDPMEALKRAGRVIIWILGYIAAIAVVGVLAASAMYLIGYLFLEAKTGWKIPIIGTVLIIVGLSVMRELLNLEWPAYLLQDTVESVFGLG